MLLMKRDWGFTEARLGIDGSVPLIQLVARGLGVTQAKARWNNTEGSAFQFNQRNDSIQSNESASTFKAFQVVILHNDHTNTYRLYRTHVSDAKAYDDSWKTALAQ